MEVVSENTNFFKRDFQYSDFPPKRISSRLTIIYFIEYIIKSSGLGCFITSFLTKKVYYNENN